MGILRNDSRFIRWQAVLVKQLGFTNNLLITLTIAVVGFIINYVSSNNIGGAKPSKVTLLLSLVMFLFSLLVGVVLSVSRLMDYRVTLRKIRAELHGQTSNMKDHKRWMSFYGSTSWILLWAQIWSFFIASFLGSWFFIKFIISKLGH